MASAKSSYLSSFNNYYNTGDTRLDSCDTCHAGPNGGSTDPYGRAYSSSGRNFASIEDSDSDGDGFTNLEEINALTFPGNASDFPEPAAEPVPELISEPIDNVTEASVEEIIDNQSMEEPIVNETQEETTTEQQSPGFETILTIAGILSVVYLKRRV
ncbi:PGF-CTERM sorting domain-containing protein [uncultured Methanolobus sp.]|uniref:PGF-CTERM sorting domain-containing protein n=1 Tax=uncultured Methanolobus sp. TaxID=218300 RepID=UPI003749BD13